jgi:hypothetical protein
MRLSLAAFTFVSLAACAREVPTKDFVGVKERICACTDSACAKTLVAEVRHLRQAGSEPEHPGDAKAALDAALVCALKLDPEITKRLETAF